MKPNEERIVALEVNMMNISKDINDIKVDVKTIKELLVAVPDHEKRLSSLERAKTGIYQWTPILISNLLTATFIFLLLEYIKKI